jgi:hypothetical protein
MFLIPEEFSLKALKPTPVFSVPVVLQPESTPIIVELLALFNLPALTPAKAFCTPLLLFPANEPTA